MYRIIAAARRALRGVANVFDYSLLHVRMRGPAGHDHCDRPSILVIKMDGIGDYVIFSRTSWIYRALHPDARIVFLCRPETTDLARANPWFDQVLPLDLLRIEKDRNYQLAALRDLRNRRFLAVYHPTWGKTPWTEWVTRLVRARYRVGVAGARQPQLDYPFGRAYDIVFPMPPAPFSEMDVYDSFARDLYPPYQPRRVPFWLPQDIEYVEALTRSRRLPDRPFVLFFPGAGADFRRWPSRSWIELARRIIPAGFHVLLAGSTSDRPQNAEIAAGLPADSVFDLTGLTTVRQLALLISKASFLVSTETSAIHIGAHLSIPNVCIMGGGHWRRFYPYGDPQVNRVAAVLQDCFSCDWTCFKAHPDCVSCIPVDVVWNECLQLPPLKTSTLQS